MNDMSTRIADARKNIGMTQKALAEKLGIAASTLNGYEKGNHKPDSEILIAVSNITGCTVDYLLGRVDGFNEFFKKENSPAPAETEVEEIEKWLTDLLVDRGYIRSGEDISNRDADFLIHWIGLLDAWFEKE